MAVYAVTGAAGFIGAHLVAALLAEGHEVRGLDDLSTGRLSTGRLSTGRLSTGRLDPRCALTVGDVADPAAVHTVLAGADGCFHLAAVASLARTIETWSASHRTNLGGTVAVLEGARDAGGIPVVYASSAAVYGSTGGRVACEACVPRPGTPYGIDKLGSEMHARAAWEIHGVPSFGLRLFNVYGPGQDPLSPYSGVIAVFARRIAAGQAVTVHGDGGQIRDFVHVGDVVRHMTAAMRLTAGERTEGRPGAAVANVCSGHGTSLLELAGLLGDIHGCRPALAFGPKRPGDVRVSVGDPSQARALLGVSAEVSLRAGLMGMMEGERLAA